MKYGSVIHTVGAADALTIAHLGTKRQIMVITATAAEANRLREEIAWFAPNKRIVLFPDWETLPYERFSPHQDLVSERLSTLYALMNGDADIVIIPASTALLRLAPKSFLAGHVFFLNRGERLNIDQFRSQLTIAGYTHVSHVVAAGEYAIRGGLIDVFPMGAQTPFRLDLFDDEIESIRIFDVETQRTEAEIAHIRLLPAHEFPTNDQGRTHFRTAFRAYFEGDPSKSQLYKDVSQGVMPSGIEYYLPFFFEETASIFDYLPQSAAIILHDDVNQQITEWRQETNSRYRLLSADRDFPLLKPEMLFLSPEQFFERIHTFDTLKIRTELQESSEIQTKKAAAITHIASALPPLAIERQSAEPLQALKDFLATSNPRVLLTVESAGRAETVSSLLKEHGIIIQRCHSFSDFLANDAACMMSIAPIQTGFTVQAIQPDIDLPALTLITENALYPNAIRTRARRQGRGTVNIDHWVRDLVELKVGDLVVHQSYGIGCYDGLVSKNFGEGETEFLQLSYASGDKLYVPVSQLHVISRYTGLNTESVDLNRLGTAQWEKARRKAAEQARDTAAELLLHYAKRAARSGYAFQYDEADYDTFVSGFGFEETPDQAQAIFAVLNDMRSEKPMDRLVCGDVGFGKTEVALRAAFIAIQAGKQAAILAPTTLLVEQHYRTFCERFAEWPVRIAQLSRFRTKKELTADIQAISEGKIDIVIGTHRLLQKDVQFLRLGLLIIDEEHRFGVRQKEQLKILRTEVDTLRLTATPIPRSLAMSIEGLSDFSVIATAPQKRLAIRTFVNPFSKGIIREACLRELKRGGQIYFLHNDVSSMESMYAELQAIVPEAKIQIGHGQMPERELEQVMRDFVHQRFNLLLCTTIIETGIDIPNANTILINKANQFGLAQLHQLRGRVGRSHHQAYAYLLTPPEVKLSSVAEKRLNAIQSMGELGSGFYLAMHDLEIRGAGEILGESQSGEIQEVGFRLYQDMLERAIDMLQRGEEPNLDAALPAPVEINLHLPALLPDHYCADVHERLTLYKRLSDCQDLDELILLREELIDRFGKLPSQADTLMATHRLRIAAQSIGVIKIDATETEIILQFSEQTDIDPYRLIQIVQQNRNYRFRGSDRLVIQAKTDTLAVRVKAIDDALRLIVSPPEIPQKKDKAAQKTSDHASSSGKKSSKSKRMVKKE